MTNIDESYGLWADSHVFYDKLLNSGKHFGPFAERETQWQKQLVTEAPNGSLLADNNVFSALRKDKKISLLHVSHKFESITNHGTIYPSGGCLVGSIYCTPLMKQRDGYKMHNLGEYILTKEAPMIIKNLGPHISGATPLIIELTLPDSAYRGLAGIDYLRLGNIHLQIFSNLEYLLSKAERHRLRDSVVVRIKNSMQFLSLCSGIYHEDFKVDPSQFIDALNGATNQLPILGYLYFEVLSEYLMLYSQSPATQEFMLAKEFNNTLYKKVLFGTFPGMAGKFNLSTFRPSPSALHELIGELDSSIDFNHMMAYLRDRLIFVINARLFANELKPRDWQHMRWEFDELKIMMAPLIGHIIHRELRTFGRYPDFYFYFDQYKALEVWNYWNQMDIVVPFNGTFPKGEVGINPAYPDLKYNIYKAALMPSGLLEPIEKLDLTIAPRLVDLKYTLMRTSNGAQHQAPQRQSPQRPPAIGRH